MKLWGSVKQQAGKLAFDAEKAMRVRREEGAIAALREKMDAQYTALGREALALMAEGAITHPRLAPYAEEVARLQDQIKEQAQELVATQTEEYASEGPAEETPAAQETPSDLDEPTFPPPPPPPSE